MVNEDLHTKDVTLTEASLQAFIGKIKNDIQQSSTRQDFRIVDEDLLREPIEGKPNEYYGEFTEKEVRDNLGNIAVINKKIFAVNPYDIVKDDNNEILKGNDLIYKLQTDLDEKIEYQFYYNDNKIYIKLTNESYQDINNLLNYTYYNTYEENNIIKYKFYQFKLEQNTDLEPQEYYSLTEEQFKKENVSHSISDDEKDNYRYLTTDWVSVNDNENFSIDKHINLIKTSLPVQQSLFRRAYFDKNKYAAKTLSNNGFNETDNTLNLYSSIGTKILGKSAISNVKLIYNYTYPIHGIALYGIDNSLEHNGNIHTTDCNPESLFGSALPFIYSNDENKQPFSFNVYKANNLLSEENATQYKDNYIYDIQLFTDSFDHGIVPQYENDNNKKYYNGNLTLAYAHSLDEATFPRAVQVEGKNEKENTDIYTDNINNNYNYTLSIDFQNTYTNSSGQTEKYYTIQYTLFDKTSTTNINAIDAWNKDNGASKTERYFKFKSDLNVQILTQNNTNNETTTIEQTYYIESDYIYLSISFNDEISYEPNKYYYIDSEENYQLSEDENIDDNITYYQRQERPWLYSKTITTVYDENGELKVLESQNNPSITINKIDSILKINKEFFNNNSNNNFNLYFTDDCFVSVGQEELNKNTDVMLYNEFYFTRAVTERSCPDNTTLNSSTPKYNYYTQTNKAQKIYQNPTENYTVTFSPMYKGYYFIDTINYRLYKYLKLSMKNSGKAAKVDTFTYIIPFNADILNYFKAKGTTKSISFHDFILQPNSSTLRYVGAVDWTKVSNVNINNFNSWETKEELFIAGTSSTAISYIRYYDIASQFLSTRGTDWTNSNYFTYRIYYMINSLKDKINNGIAGFIESLNDKYIILPGYVNTTMCVCYLKKKNDDGTVSLLEPDEHNCIKYNAPPVGQWYQVVFSAKYFVQSISVTNSTNNISGKIKDTAKFFADSAQKLTFYADPTNTSSQKKTLSVAANVILDAAYQNAYLYYEGGTTSTDNTAKFVDPTTIIEKTSISYVANNQGNNLESIYSIDKTDSPCPLDIFIQACIELYGSFYTGQEDDGNGNVYKQLPTIVDNNSGSQATGMTENAMTLPTKDHDTLIYEYNADDLIVNYKDQSENQLKIQQLKYQIQGENKKKEVVRTLGEKVNEDTSYNYLYIISTDPEYKLTNTSLNNYIPADNNDNYRFYISSIDYTSKSSIQFENENDIKKDQINNIKEKVVEKNIEIYAELPADTTINYKLKYNCLIDDNKIIWDKYASIPIDNSNTTKDFPLYNINTNKNEIVEELLNETTGKSIMPLNLLTYQSTEESLYNELNQNFYKDNNLNITSGRHYFLENFARRLEYIDSFSQINPYPDNNYKLIQSGQLIDKNTNEEKILNGTFSIKNPFGDIGTLVKIHGYDDSGNLIDPSVSGIITINNESDAWRRPIIDEMTEDIVIAPETENGNLYASIVTRGGIAAAKTIKGERLYGAVWNDYAEYRQTPNVAPGRCVIEQGDGTLHQSTERLQPGASIVSDTYGFGVGETALAKTPIAVSGRVLAYPYEDRNSYKPGAAVCSGPNGTISMMTREEIREWPDCIVGTVSEIPQYEKWGTDAVNVDGRIWIKIK